MTFLDFFVATIGIVTGVLAAPLILVAALLAISFVVLVLMWIVDVVSKRKGVRRGK